MDTDVRFSFFFGNGMDPNTVMGRVAEEGQAMRTCLWTVSEIQISYSIKWKKFTRYKHPLTTEPKYNMHPDANSLPNSRDDPN